jgi:hypothetical protein
MCNAAERGQFQTPDTPRITAISDISRPIPENNAIETSGWLSDFSDEAGDAGICVETRTAFGMSGSPIHKRSKNPRSSGMSWHPLTRFNGPAQNWKIPPRGERSDQHNFDAISRRSVLIGFVICENAA